MPNWCQNVAYIKHEDKAEIDAIIAELDKKGDAQLFNSLVPNPSGEWQYDWSVENWGTKWDASIYEYWYDEEAEHLYISFDTAWGPPIVFYDKLGEMEFEVEAYYREEGMAFCGRYVDGSDYYYEYANLSADEIEEQIPSDIDEMFSISEYQRQCEEDEDWDPEAALDEIVADFDNVEDDSVETETDEKNLVFKTQKEKDWLLGLLREQNVTVTFVKKDGSERIMTCTLLENKIPSEKLPKSEKKVKNSDSVAVFDLEKQEWRSFRFDSIKKIEASLIGE